MRRARYVALHAAAALGIAVLLLVAGVLIITQTDWGREQVRRFALERLNDSADGEVRIGRVEGNLLRRIRLVDVSIVDAQGRPFVRADTLATGFSLRGLVRQRLIFRAPRLVNAAVVLDRPPGEDWNWVRIFPRDPDAADPDRRGWGTWIELHDVTLIDSRVTVRTEWKPPDDLPPEKHEEALRAALSAETRENVVPVPGGYQNVMDFRELNAELTRVRPTHPDRAGVPIEVARLSGIAQPFRPPAAVVEALSVNFRIARDTLFYNDVQAVLPGSRIAAHGYYALDAGELMLRMRGAPASFADFRWLYPALPEEGGGTLQLGLHRRSVVTHIVADDMDLRLGESTLEGRIDLTFGDTVRLRETDVRFVRLDTRVIERVIPAVDPPRHGELTGRLRLTGPPEQMEVDGDVTFADEVAGTSRVLAVGEFGVGDDEVNFRDLRLRFQPLQAELVRAFEPRFPLRGSITGYAHLTGSATGPLQLDSDLALRDPRAGLSRVRAAGGVDFRDQLRLQDMLLRFDPLRLDLLRDEVPQLPRGGLLAGQVRLDGVPQRALRVDGNLSLTDPATGLSRVAATGGIGLADGLAFRDLRLRFDPLRLDLIREHVPELPAGAILAGPLRLDGSSSGLLGVDGDLTLTDPRTGVSQVAAVGGLVLGEELAFRDLRLRFDPLQTNLVRGWLPDFPPGGTLAGVVRLDGVPDRMLEVDGDLTHRDPRLGVSRVAATGGIGLGDELRFRDLDLQFSPLRLELVQAYAPDLPLGGTLEGTATLAGSPASRIGFEADLQHWQAGEHSHVAGRGEVVTGPQGWASVDLMLRPLSLVTAGRFAPAAGLHGSASGKLQAHGDLRELAFRTDLQFDDGGMLAGTGTLDLASSQPGYVLDLTVDGFDLAAVTRRAPAATDLTGTVAARGRGTDPSTMNATLAADLFGSEVEGLPADQVHLRLAIADGLATFEDTRVRLRTAEVDLDGSFGLVASRHGVLTYRLEIDSLHAFAGWVPGTRQGVPAPLPDTVLLPEPPLPVFASSNGFTEAELAPSVERTVGVTRVRYPGAPSTPTPGAPGITVPMDPVPNGVPPEAPAESVRVAEVSADSLAGRVSAAGTLSGNLEQFDLRGTAEVEELVVAGNAMGSGRAGYAFADVRTPQLDVGLAFDASEIRVAAMEFDRANAQLRYRGDRYGAGRLSLEAYQDEDTDLRLDAEFALSLERSELRVADLELRFDTVTWQTSRPGVVRWGGAGIELEAVELTSNLAGRIFLDGRLPVEGAGDLEVVIDDLEIGHVAALFQEDLDAAGRLSLEATVRGTRRSPRFEGELLLLEASFDGRDWPETRASFAYGDLRLTADALLLHKGRQLAVIEAQLPIDLGLTLDVEQRLLEGPLAVDLRADSLPLDAVPAFTEHVDDLEGRIMGNLAVRGTVQAPTLDGVVEVDLASFYLVPVEVRFRDIVGTLRLQGGSVTVDSLIARNGGPIRVSGAIELPRLTEPVFDLEVEAREALVIDTDRTRLLVDADVDVTGTLAALRVSGDVRTREGVIRIPELADFGGGDVVNFDDAGSYARVDTLFAFERELIEAENSLLANLHLDLAVHIDRDVWIRSTEANVEIYTPVEVGPLRILMNGGPSTVALDGILNTDRGDYLFVGRRFRLTRGAVTFTGEPEFNPFIQVTAEHEVRLPNREGFDIRVVLTGTLEDLGIALESSAQPPISQTDLMSYLAFGRDASSLLQLQGSTLAGEGDVSGGLVGNVAALATQQLASVALDEIVRDLERDAARELRLDVIRITPADLPPEVFTGRYVDVLRGTEIEAGRYLTPRVFLAGQVRPTFVRPGVRVEYRMPLDLFWVTSWQPRYLPSEPSLEERDPIQTTVFGSFLFREWRF